VRIPVHYAQISMQWVLSEECNPQFVYLRRWARDCIETEDSIDY